MNDTLAKDIERALSAHARHITDGPMKDAWAGAPARLRAATDQAALDSLYFDLRAAGRWESRDITAGAALAALNGLLTRVRQATPEPAPEPAPEAP